MAIDKRSILASALAGLRKDALKANRSRDRELMIRIGMAEPEGAQAPSGEEMPSAPPAAPEGVAVGPSEPAEEDLMLLLAEPEGASEEDEDEDDEEDAI